MTHFKKILDDYANELVVPKGDRQAAFASLESRLKKLIAKMEELKPSAKHLPTGEKLATTRVGPEVSPVVGAQGRVKALTEFHSRQITNVGAIDRQAALLVRTRQWLFRQGATLSPNGTIIWKKSDATVKYDTELAQQAMTKISIESGLLYTARNTLLDTRQMVTAASGPGWCIYVMSGENHIHVSSHSVGARHHSSLLAGANVACAGEMEVRDGRLLTLSNKSGHYMPEPAYLTQVIRVLADTGVDEDSYAVLEYCRPNEKPKLHQKARLFMDTQRCPVWPTNDIDSDALVANPRYAAAYAFQAYGSGSEDFYRMPTYGGSPPYKYALK